MKRKPTAYILLFVTACALLAGCGRSVSDADRLLARIDSLADVDPDSADVLKPTPSPSLKGGEKEVWELLRIKIDDKLYRPVTHYRDTILRLISYFEQHPKVLPSVLGSTGPALPYLYAGRIFADLGDAPQALDYYQRALDVQPAGQMENGKVKIENEDARRLAKQRGLLHSFIGTLLSYQYLFDDAIHHFFEANHWAIFASDTLDMIYNYRDIAEQYKFKEDIDSSLVFYQKALDISIFCQRLGMRNEIMAQMARLYVEKGQINVAYSYIQPAFNKIDSADLTSTYCIASLVYKKKQKIDSALYCYDKLLRYGNLYGKRFAYRELLEIEERNSGLQHPYDYLREYKNLDDSIQKRNRTETVARMHAAYNYQKHERRAKDMEISSEKRKKMFLFSSSIAIITILLLAIISLAFKKYKREQQQKMHILQEARDRIERSGIAYRISTEQEISVLKEKIESLKKDFSNKENSFAEEMADMESKKQMLEFLLNKQIAEQQLKLDIVEQVSQSPIYKKFRLLADRREKIPTSKEWNELSEVVNVFYPAFENRLRQLVKLNSQQYHACLLRKLEFGVTDISFLVCYAKPSVDTLFCRLHQKATGEKGSVTGFSDFLRYL